MPPATPFARAEHLQRWASRHANAPLGTWKVWRKLASEHALFLDGLNSSSPPVENWIRRFEKRCPAAGDFPLNGFSYRAPGWRYRPSDTWQSIYVEEATFLRHIPTDASVVPIGFSIGATVALLGSWLGTVSGRIKLDQLILVAPVHGPNMDVLEEYEGLVRLARDRSLPPDLQDIVGRRTPRPIVQLCGADPTWREDVQRAYRELTSQGVRIHVIYSPADVFAAYSPPRLPARSSGNLRLYAIRAKPRGTKQLPLQDALEQIDYHVELRGAPEFLDAICQILGST